MSPPKAIDKAEDQVVIFPVELWEGPPAAENGLDGGGQAGESAGVVTRFDEGGVHKSLTFEVEHHQPAEADKDAENVDER